MGIILSSAILALLGGVAVGLIHDHVKRNNLKSSKPDAEDKIFDDITNLVDLANSKKMGMEPETIITDKPRKSMRSL